jgi:hypothetical protein
MELINKCVLEYANKCTKALKNFSSEFYVVQKSYKIDYSLKRAYHRGGMYDKGPGFNMCGADFARHYRTYKLGYIGMFQEYPALANDPIIGSAYIDTWQQYVMLTVGHEMAHACQQYVEQLKKMVRGSAHGEYFQKIYQIIRLELNKELPDQVMSAEKYARLLKSIKKREMYVNKN